MSERILIVRLSALGDTALTLPLLSALRERLPRAFIGWAVGEAASPLLEGAAGLDRVHVWHRGKGAVRELARLVREIRACSYDVSLDVQGLTKSAIIPFLARIPRRVGLAPGRLEGRELSPLLSTELVRPPDGVTHIVARQLHMGAALGLEAASEASAEVPVDAGALDRVRDWLREAGLTGRAIVLGVGAGWPTKVFPVECVAALAAVARERGFACVVIWGPAERASLDSWRAAFAGSASLAPETGVREMIALLSLAERYAGPDSAALHLASLLGKPTFSWYGASDPARVAPSGPRHARFSRGLRCQHCWRRRCRSGECVRLPSVGEMVAAFDEWLSG